MWPARHHPASRGSYPARPAQLSAAGFEVTPEWGEDLGSEHERYLTEVLYAGCPVIVTDYPKDIKAFYMRMNEDERTVAAMDILVANVRCGQGWGWEPSSQLVLPRPIAPLH